jgi:hypothetical protein
MKKHEHAALIVGIVVLLVAGGLVLVFNKKAAAATTPKPIPEVGQVVAVNWDDNYGYGLQYSNGVIDYYSQDGTYQESRDVHTGNIAPKHGK